MRLTQLVHQEVKKILPTGGFAIDATVGNGYDTLFLAQCVGPTGKVIGFDIQQQALDTTRQRLLHHNLLPQVTLFHASHADMATHCPPSWKNQVKAILFNLGYLPKSDKKIITHSHTTLQALQTALTLLHPQGIITILTYPNHSGGLIEETEVNHYLTSLTPTIKLHAYKSSGPNLWIIKLPDKKIIPLSHKPLNYLTPSP